MELEIREIELRGRLDGRQRNQLKGLLDMEYTPRELAEEIGVNVSQVYRVYLPIGCPRRRDTRRHYWINGELFREWYQERFQKIKLSEYQVFCLTCKKAVDLIDPEKKRKRGLIYYECLCPICGRKLAKIIDREK